MIRRSSLMKIQHQLIQVQRPIQVKHEIKPLSNRLSLPDRRCFMPLHLLDLCMSFRQGFKHIASS